MELAKRLKNMFLSKTEIKSKKRTFEKVTPPAFIFCHLLYIKRSLLPLQFGYCIGKYRLS